MEDDGAEGCGANPSHLKRAELECEVASPRRQCYCDGDQISWVGEIYLVLYPDPAGHRGDQAEQHDRQATDDGTWDREDKSTEFWREAHQDRDDRSNDKTEASNRPLSTPSHRYSRRKSSHQSRRRRRKRPSPDCLPKTRGLSSDRGFCPSSHRSL